MSFEPKLLKKALKNQGITQKKLAEKLDVDKRTVSRWISGESKPSRPKLTKIANYLGVEPQQFDKNFQFGPEIRVRTAATVSAAADNGYWFLEKQYGVSKTEVIEIAPVLFALAANAALKRPQELLETASAAVEVLGVGSGFLTYEGSHECYDFLLELYAANEGKVFGGAVDQDTSFHPKDEKRGEGTQALANNLLDKWIVSETDKHQNLSAKKTPNVPGNASSSLGFSFREDLLEYICDKDEEISDAILDGKIVLRDMDEGLFGADRTQERSRWLRIAFAQTKHQEDEHSLKEKEARNLREKAWLKLWKLEHSYLELEFQELLEKRRKFDGYYKLKYRHLSGEQNSEEESLKLEHYQIKKDDFERIHGARWEQISNIRYRHQVKHQEGLLEEIKRDDPRTYALLTEDPDKKRKRLELKEQHAERRRWILETFERRQKLNKGEEE